MPPVMHVRGIAQAQWKSDEDQEFDPHPPPYDGICSFPLFKEIKIHSDQDLVCKTSDTVTWVKHLIYWTIQITKMQNACFLFSVRTQETRKRKNVAGAKHNCWFFV